MKIETPLKKERLAQRITQLDLMMETGIHYVMISHFENGYFVPKREQKAKLAKALNVPVKKLFPEKE